MQKLQKLYDAAFTDYGGQIGYAPAVATIAISSPLCGALIYGAVTVGKAMMS